MRNELNVFRDRGLWQQQILKNHAVYHPASLARMSDETLNIISQPLTKTDLYNLKKTCTFFVNNHYLQTLIDKKPVTMKMCSLSRGIDNCDVRILMNGKLWETESRVSLTSYAAILPEYQLPKVTFSKEFSGLPADMIIKDVDKNIILMENNDLYYILSHHDLDDNDRYTRIQKFCKKLDIEPLPVNCGVRQLCVPESPHIVLLMNNGLVLHNKSSEKANWQSFEFESPVVELIPKVQRHCSSQPYELIARLKDGQVYGISLDNNVVVPPLKLPLERVSRFYASQTGEFAILKDGSLWLRGDDRFAENQSFTNLVLDIPSNLSIQSIVGDFSFNLILLSNGGMLIADEFTDKKRLESENINEASFVTTFICFQPLKGVPRHANIVQMWAPGNRISHKKYQDQSAVLLLSEEGKIYSYKPEWVSKDKYGFNNEKIPFGFHFLTKIPGQPIAEVKIQKTLPLLMQLAEAFGEKFDFIDDEAVTRWSNKK